MKIIYLAIGLFALSVSAAAIPVSGMPVSSSISSEKSI